MRKKTKKFAALLLGFVVAGATAELALWLVASVHAKRLAPTSSPGAFTVLCLGNSYTVGVGAPAGGSYPEALGELLRERNPELRARVVNGGIRSATTTMVLEHLDWMLETYHPQVAAVMVGEPNFWFGYGFSAFQAKQARAAGGWATLERTAYSSHLYRFARLLLGPYYANPASTYSHAQWMGLFSSVAQAPPWIGARELADARATLSAALAAAPSDEDLSETLLVATLWARDYPAAELSAAKAARLARTRFLIFPDYLIGQLLESEKDPAAIGALQRARAALRVNYPGSETYRHATELLFEAKDLSYRNAVKALPARNRCEALQRIVGMRPLDLRRQAFAALCLDERGERLRARELLVAARSRNPLYNHSISPVFLTAAAEEKDPTRKERIRGLHSLMLDHDEYKTFDPSLSRWVQDETGQIVERLRGAGVKVVLQAYPPLRKMGMRPVDLLLPRIAERKGIPFSDTNRELRRVFAAAGGADAYYSQEFGPEDSHLNAKGYRAVAETLYETLRTESLLPRARRLDTPDSMSLR